MRFLWRFGMHPSDKRCLQWLERGDGVDVALDDHIAACDRCANRLEDLSTPIPSLEVALSQSLQAPDDLVERLGVRMHGTIQNREDLSLFFELMGVPFATVRSLMEEDS